MAGKKKSGIEGIVIVVGAIQRGLTDRRGEVIHVRAPQWHSVASATPQTGPRWYVCATLQACRACAWAKAFNDTAFSQSLQRSSYVLSMPLHTGRGDDLKLKSHSCFEQELDRVNAGIPCCKNLRLKKLR